MNILIIENEIYLAQKIVSRLLDDGHSCDYIESVNIDNLTKDYDTILLSTSLPANVCRSVINLLDALRPRHDLHHRLAYLKRYGQFDVGRHRDADTCHDTARRACALPAASKGRGRS